MTYEADEREWRDRQLSGLSADQRRDVRSYWLRQAAEHWDRLIPPESAATPDTERHLVSVTFRSDVAEAAEAVLVYTEELWNTVEYDQDTIYFLRPRTMKILDAMAIESQPYELK